MINKLEANFILKGQRTMKEKGKRLLILGGIFIIVFTVWTMLIKTIDVRQVGVNKTDIGFSSVNIWFHKLTGVHMSLYVITDWLGLVPIFVCMVFGFLGLIQLIKRRSLLKVDRDIIFLGIYYIVVIFGYLIFEMIPINYRPILIEGIMEASYPSSTTLLVLCVMPTLMEQVSRRIKNEIINKVISAFTVSFSVFMVSGRLFSGVHWLTDIIGSIMLSVGLFSIYRAAVLLSLSNENK